MKDKERNRKTKCKRCGHISVDYFLEERVFMCADCGWIDKARGRTEDAPIFGR